jgi:hypothetical protein
MQRELIDLPQSMESLRRDKRGFPVPSFVQWFDGEPDFRVVDSRHFVRCLNEKICWLCGGKLSARMFFVIGPMCGINRISSEPPSHRGCAEFAAKNCPFLTKPMAKRNERGLPTECGDIPIVAAAGQGIERNPGCCIVWETGSYRAFNVAEGMGQAGVLIEIGEAGKDTSFWREGRKATRAEVEESVVTGIPTLVKETRSDEERHALTLAIGAFAVRVLDRFLPKDRSLAS